jgi:hypothetical protein
MMNEFGEFVGFSWAGYFRWSPLSAFTALNINGYTTGINDAGDVVAIGQIEPEVTMQPFLSTPAGIHRMLANPVGENVAGPINNLRQVVGWTESDVPEGWDSMTFVWSPATGVVPIWETFGEDGGFFAAAAGFNDQATVVGMIEAPNVTPFGGGRAAVVAQLRVTPAQFANAMRVRIALSARHAMLSHGHARALLAKLDQIDRALRIGHGVKPHVKALQQQIATFSREGISISCKR